MNCRKDTRIRDSSSWAFPRTISAGKRLEPMPTFKRVTAATFTSAFRFFLASLCAAKTKQLSTDSSPATRKDQRVARFTGATPNLLSTAPEKLLPASSRTSRPTRPNCASRSKTFSPVSTNLQRRKTTIRRLRAATTKHAESRQFRIDSPHFSAHQIRKPDRSVADSNAVAPRSAPLLNDVVRRRVNPRHGNAQYRRPDRSFAKGNLPSGAGNAGSDCDREFVGLGVDARDRAISLIERPHRTGTHRQKARSRPDRHRNRCSVRLWIHAGQHAMV